VVEGDFIAFKYPENAEFIEINGCYDGTDIRPETVNSVLICTYDDHLYCEDNYGEGKICCKTISKYPW